MCLDVCTHCNYFCDVFTDSALCCSHQNLHGIMMDESKEQEMSAAVGEEPFPSIGSCEYFFDRCAPGQSQADAERQARAESKLKKSLLPLPITIDCYPNNYPKAEDPPPGCRELYTASPLTNQQLQNISLKPVYLPPALWQQGLKHNQSVWGVYSRDHPGSPSKGKILVAGQNFATGDVLGYYFGKFVKTKDWVSICDPTTPRDLINYKLHATHSKNLADYQKEMSERKMNHTLGSAARRRPPQPRLDSGHVLSAVSDLEDYVAPAMDGSWRAAAILPHSHMGMNELDHVIGSRQCPFVYMNSADVMGTENIEWPSPATLIDLNRRLSYLYLPIKASKPIASGDEILAPFHYGWSNDAWNEAIKRSGVTAKALVKQQMMQKTMVKRAAAGFALLSSSSSSSQTDSQQLWTERESQSENEDDAHNSYSQHHTEKHLRLTYKLFGRTISYQSQTEKAPSRAKSASSDSRPNYKRTAQQEWDALGASDRQDGWKVAGRLKDNQYACCSFSCHTSLTSACVKEIRLVCTFNNSFFNHIFLTDASG